MMLKDYVNGIGHLGIIVLDVDEAMKFYTEKLGFSPVLKKLVIDPLDGAINIGFVKQQNLLLELFTPFNIRNSIVSRKDGIIDHFAIDCGNVEKAYDELSKKGLKLHSSTADGVTYYNNLGCKGVVGVNFLGSFGEVVEICKTNAKQYNGCDSLGGWSHLAIKVHNLNRSLEFYSKLGFKKCGDGFVDTPFGRLQIAFVVCHGFMLEIIQVCGELINDLDNRGAGHIDHFALDVSDAKEAFYAAKAEGFQLVNNVTKELNLFKNGIEYFMIKGPDGEIIELNQKKDW